MNDARAQFIYPPRETVVNRGQAVDDGGEDEDDQNPQDYLPGGAPAFTECLSLPYIVAAFHRLQDYIIHAET
jgi:hypothetical protein